MRYAVVLAVALGIAGPASAGDRYPVVVELFTSQGCSSCPPADAFLGELARRPDIIALSLHVDYWDYIGWKDPFAQRAFTERQRAYSRALQQRYVYTPQMVIGGRLQGVGSDRGVVDRLIREAKAQAAEAAWRPSLQRVGDELHLQGGGPAAAVVWLAFYDAVHRTRVPRGENAGRQLANYNVVREWRVLGRYEGKPTRLPLNFDANLDKRGAAIVVQAETPAGPGPIVAALAIPPRR